MNDETVYQLCKQAVSQARAGVDIISPSYIFDGCVGAMREAFDEENFNDVSIMSCIKYFLNPLPQPMKSLNFDSGEYCMVKGAGILKLLDVENYMMGALMSLRIAGADIIVTYFARSAATVLAGVK